VSFGDRELKKRLLLEINPARAYMFDEKISDKHALKVKYEKTP
jgi:hypothetical protein